MKTTVIESNKSNGKLNSSAVNNGAENKSGQPKTNGLPLSKEFDNKAKDETGPKKTEIPAKVTEQPKPQEAPQTETAQPTTGQAEPTKAEIREQIKFDKPALNLEGTLKLVEELHRRKIQRDKLLSTINTLEEFEVAQKDDAEETDSNHFQGCELTIEDDQRRQFTTKNPYIIKKVAEYINALCMDKLSEIEGEIYIPA